MKILPMLLVNLVMVGGGLFVYDHLRSEPRPAESVVAAGVDATEVARIVDERLSALPAREPVLRASGVDERFATRLRALEERLARAEPTAAPSADPAESTDEVPLAAPAAADAGGEPSEEEVRRMRKVMERAEQLRREEREVARLDQMLDRLEIDLSQEQKGQLLASQRAYRTKMGETMREIWSARQPGEDREGAREAARAAMEQLRTEYVQDLQTFLSAADAQKISEGGGMWGGGMRGGFGRGRGR